MPIAYRPANIAHFNIKSSNCKVSAFQNQLGLMLFTKTELGHTPYILTLAAHWIGF